MIARENPINRLRVVRSLYWSWFFAAALASAAGAQPAQPDYTPRVGLAGKDVVWVPTPDAMVEKMLDMAKVTANDYVIDLGSGDGRTVITAAKRGARAHGIEYNPDMVALSKRHAVEAGVADRATFAKADLFESDFSRATVITMFLLPQINLKLRPKILDLQPGTRIVSNSFTMGDWPPDETATAGGDCDTWCTALLWIVPAKVEGRWRLGDGELTLTQTFQKVAGTLKTASNAAAIQNGRLIGDEIHFTAAGRDYFGRVSGDTIAGTVNGAAWAARRASR